MTVPTYTAMIGLATDLKIQVCELSKMYSDVMLTSVPPTNSDQRWQWTQTRMRAVTCLEALAYYSSAAIASITDLFDRAAQSEEHAPKQPPPTGGDTPPVPTPAA